MDEDEITRYVELGAYGAVTVDRVIVPRYPGYVREVVFQGRNRVTVAFHAYEEKDDAAFEFYCEFASLSEAIGAVEGYMGRPAGGWENHNRSGRYPELEEGADPEAALRVGHLNLVTDILGGRLHLPAGTFTPAHEIPWKSVEEYVQWRRALGGES